VLEDEQIILADSFERQRENIWKSVQSQHPDSYDGNLLALKKFSVNNDDMILHMNIIKFSRILTLEKLGEHLRPYGTIGMQMIVLSPDKKHILIGQRSSNSLYCPNFFSCPGGMLEVVDAKGSFEEACLREFNEEVDFVLSDDLRVHAITSEIHGTVGAAFILSGTTKENPDVESSVIGNEEWEGSHLRWYSVQNLEMFAYSNSLESVVFVKEEREKFDRNEANAFW
jgi:ADP-ribose pyrophosphatase YjhB (NUDIX family)